MMRKTMLGMVTALVLAGNSASAQSVNAAPGTTGPITVEAEALLWWFKSSPTPAPIITDDVAGRAGTNVLLGGGDLDTNPNWGFRLSGGYALDARWAVQGNFLYFATRSTSQSVSSPGTAGSTDLLLPYFDVVQNREAVTEISFAPVYAGRARTELRSGLMGAEANASYALDSARAGELVLIGGVRWLQLKETYTISTSSPFIPPNPSGEFWDTTDKFAANNNFYGAQFGMRSRYDSGRWFASGIAKLGLGAMVQSVDVEGSLVTNDFNHFGSAETFTGGYFALPTNIGGHTRTVFAVVPELRLDVGYRITPSVSLFAGYSFLYANSVARPGNQLNRNINTTQSASWTGDPNPSLQGAAQPSFSFNSSSFWAQGINIGLGIRF